jgi:hypothetical protein
MKMNHPFVELVYNKNKEVDSIYLLNFYKTNYQPIRVKKCSEKTCVLYQFLIPSDLYGTVHSYLLFSSSKVVDYTFPTPIVSPDSTIECLVTNIQANHSISQMCVIKQKDTVDFINNLLRGKRMSVKKIIDEYEQSTFTDKSLTILKYFGLMDSSGTGVQ